MRVDVRSVGLALVMGITVLAGPAPHAEADAARPARPAASPGPTGEVLALATTGPGTRDSSAPERCTRDRAYCIALANYIPDVCRLIEELARANALDPNFFARLLWKESLFDAGAVSPAGAQGIAQFIPETAQRRGLEDAFNPAEALYASARYLSDLSRDFGNIGLAAAAYNSGEARVERFVSAQSGLPAETRAYVQAITGQSVEIWRDAPPAALDLSLGGENAFQSACIAHAADRNLREFRSAPPLHPWGVIVASNRSAAGAERQVARLQNRHAPVLRGEPVVYTSGRRPGMSMRLHYAQIGRDSRAEGDDLCHRLQAEGGDCMVVRN